MEKLMIVTSYKSYPVIIGDGIRHGVLGKIQQEYSSFYVITDEHVAGLYLEDVKKAFAGPQPVHSIVIPAGEISKGFKVYQNILDDMFRLQLDRNACIIALGGGVIGDVAGFVAATFLRGVSFIQMPTTLLAHDSSVGGKVGINHSAGKNLIGAFYQPDAVLYDTETLRTLPDREWASGLAELIKHALIDSEVFYDQLREELRNKPVESLPALLKKAIAVKADIVSEDERESGVRALLNFGHTLGHAAEKVGGYDTFTHGEAVSIGMIYALHLSEAVYNTKLPIDEIQEWLASFGLPVSIPEGWDIDDLMQYMKMDKKRKDHSFVFVLLKGIGEPEIEQVSEDVVRSVLQRWMQRS